MDSSADEAGPEGVLTAQQYRHKYNMWVHPKDAPPPMQTFEQAQLPPQLLKGVSAGLSARLH